MTRQGFHSRSWVAFLMATGFLVATVTGTVLYVVPKGNIANWTGWTLGGLDKETWSDVHIVTGAMFILAGIAHVYFNWKPLKAYFRSKAANGLNRRSELFAALAVTGFLVAGAVEGWPPVSYVLEFNDWARTGLWETPQASGGGRETARVIAVPAPEPVRETAHEQALARAAEGIDAALTEALGDRAEPEEEHAFGGGQAVGQGGGRGQAGASGFGRMTLSELAAAYGLDYLEVTKRLAAKGIPVSGDEPLRTIAARAGMTPGELGALAREAEH